MGRRRGSGVLSLVQPSSDFQDQKTKISIKPRQYSTQRSVRVSEDGKNSMKLRGAGKTVAISKLWRHSTYFSLPTATSLSSSVRGAFNLLRCHRATSPSAISCYRLLYFSLSYCTTEERHDRHGDYAVLENDCLHLSKSTTATFCISDGCKEVDSRDE